MLWDQKWWVIIFSVVGSKMMGYLSVVGSKMMGYLSVVGSK